LGEDESKQKTAEQLKGNRFKISAPLLKRSNVVPYLGSNGAASGKTGAGGTGITMIACQNGRAGLGSSGKFRNMAWRAPEIEAGG
jgi:hypothetical protein